MASGKSEFCLKYLIKGQSQNSRRQAECYAAVFVLKNMWIIENFAGSLWIKSENDIMFVDNRNCIVKIVLSKLYYSPKGDRYENSSVPDTCL